MSCTANSGVLGSAGATGSTANFPNVTFTDTWYPVTLASKIAGSDRSQSGVHINANFNSNLGTPGCLENSAWYYGLDVNQSATQTNLVTVVLHELAHGLGFSLGPTSLTTGSHAQGLPSIYERLLFDIGTAKNWIDMTDAERVSSAISTGNVVWTGPTVLATAANVLGTPVLQITAPPAIAGTYAVGTADFGAAITATPLAGQLVVATDAENVTGPTSTDACTTITNPGAISGKIAVVDRGTCLFVEKAANVQAAGAIAMVVVDNVAGSPPPGLGGTDPSITIPAVRITQADGTAIKTQLAIPTTVNGSLALDMTKLAGADSQGRPKLYAPNPLEGGSSISHWDTSTFPNQLMEPNISDDLSHSVKAPQDLTLALMRDIGWTADAVLTGALSQSALAFGNRLMGYGSFFHTVSFSNTGNGALTIASVAVSGSGDFSRTHNCPSSLNAGASCTVTVAYNPTSLAQQTGTLTITTDAPGSPHTMSITGTGIADLSFSIARPRRPARTGTGQASIATFELTITPSAGFGSNQEVALSCAGQADMSCAIQPSRVTIAGAPVSVDVTVKVAARSLRLRRLPHTEKRVITVTAIVGGVARSVALPVEITR